MTKLIAERHPLQPFLPESATALLLGSFPPPRAKWKMNFFYPNFQNDMWRIFGLVFFADKDYFLTENRKFFDKEQIVRFLTEKGIALFDTAQEAIRHKGNASDNFLEIVTPVDMRALLEKIPQCRAIATTGEKATETVLSLLPYGTKKPSIGDFETVSFMEKTCRFYRMPSSSRAYPKPLAEKAAVYENFFRETGLF